MINIFGSIGSAPRNQSTTHNQRIKTMQTGCSAVPALFLFNNKDIHVFSEISVKFYRLNNRNEIS